MWPTSTRRVVADDGTPIAARVTGDGDAVVLVHSAASDARQWARLMPLLAPSFNVVAMDRRGRGASGPQRPGHSLAVDYGDVAAVGSSISGPVHLVGHSSGARYALHAALRIPGLTSLVLYEPPAPEGFCDASLDRMSVQESAGDREGVLRTFFVDLVGVEDEEFSMLGERPIWPLMVDNALTVPAELRAARSYRFDPAAFAGLAVPTLLLVGELSGPELRTVAGRIADALPDARVVTLAGQGHGAMFSAPDLLASVLQGFFEEVGHGPPDRSDGP